MCCYAAIIFVNTMCIYSLGRQLVEKGFVIYFLKVLLACLAAAVQPNSMWNSPNEFSTSCHSRVYKATHLLANLGWVDFDFGFPTLCLVLPGLMRNWQNWLSSWARWRNISIQSQFPTEVRQEMDLPLMRKHKR